MLEKTLLVLSRIGCENEEEEIVLGSHCMVKRTCLSFDSCFWVEGRFCWTNLRTWEFYLSMLE